MQTLERVPFGGDWARAAAHAVEVETFSVRRTLAATPAVAASPTDPGSPHVARTRKLRPDRLFAPASTTIEARHLVALVREVDFYSAARALPAACQALGIPFVVTEHSTRLTGASAAHKPFTARNRRTAARVYGAAARVVAVSDHLRSCIEGAGLASDVAVVPNPVDDLGAGTPRQPVPGRVVSVGRLESDKGPMLLLEAMAIVAAQRADASLVLLGDGPERSAIEARAAAPDLSGRVTVRVRVPRSAVASELAASACFALASTVETFCIAAAEAVIAGVPVVMPRLPPVVEVVGGYGQLVEHPSSAALASAILDVLATPPAGWPAGERAQRQQRFAPAEVGRRLAVIYDEVAVRR
jgi:glycosyltransferase involved in cell wall biosynthesis